MRAGGFTVAMLLAAAPAWAQTAPGQDPFVMPPPSQRPAPGQPAPGIPPGLPPATPSTPAVTLDVLVRQGFEIKAVERASERGGDFVVMVQRSGELRTCLMRLTRDANRNFRRESVCF